MTDSDRKEFSRLLSATMELYGTKITHDAATLWWAALARFDLPQVRSALSAHIQDGAVGKFSPKPADIIARLQVNDGHPGPEEAWSQVGHAIGDENATILVTGPMREAFYAAEGIERDAIASRMAFREVYVREVSRARSKGEPVEWGAILGFDRQQRDNVVLAGVRDGKLLPSHASSLLSYKNDPLSIAELTALAPPEAGARIGAVNVKRIEGDSA